MRFRFRFTPLLQQREHLLRDAQSALAEAQRRYEAIQAQLGQIQKDLEQQWKLWEESQLQGLDADTYLSLKYYIELLERQLLSVERESHKASVELSKRKQRMLEQDKAVKVLKNLEEKDKEAFRYLRAQAEQKQLDEVAIFKDFRERTTMEKD